MRFVSRRLVLLTVAGALVWPGVYSLTRSASTTKPGLTLVSDQYRLDKIYHSMEGPMSIQSGIRLATAEKSKVQWITGLETQVVDATEQKPISQEFFCHSNLTFGEHGLTPDQHNEQLGGKTHLNWRLFTPVPTRPPTNLPPLFAFPIPTHAA